MRASRPILFIATALLLGGCNPTTLGIAASPLFVQSGDINLLNSSYAAADQLSVQAGKRFPKGNTLSVLTIEEIIDTSREKIITNPKLGAVISDQLQSRFIQLGYIIPDGGESGKAQVTGLYQVMGKKLAVRLRIKNVRTGEQYAVYDYWLPITPDIRRHMNKNSGGIPIYRMREGLDEMIDN